MNNDNVLAPEENTILIVELDERLEFSTIHPMGGNNCMPGLGCPNSGNGCLGAGVSCAGSGSGCPAAGMGCGGN
jgi:hypothetical protein